MDGVWPLQDAKNCFSAVVDAPARGESQNVIRRGQWVSVVLSELPLRQRDPGVGGGSAVSGRRIAC